MATPSQLILEIYFKQTHIMKEIALIAINKFYYFSMNYPHNFIEKCWADNPSLAQHLRSKFNGLYDTHKSYGVMNAFYGELSMNNQIKLMEWVMDNFNDEQKLRFDTETQKEEKKYHYYKVDVIGIEGYSFAVKTSEEMNDGEVIDGADRAGLFAEENDYYHATVEDITDSEYDRKGLSSVTYEL